MAYGKISAKQQEILEYIKDEILHKGYPPAVLRDLSGSEFKIHFFCPLSFRDFREERLYPQGSDETACDRDHG